VANTDRWWEEALAQAVVTDSRMVKRALGINGAYMKRYMIPYFRTFPEGYKRFECESVTGGVKGAHQLLSAQIARAVVCVPDHERNTALALAKDEYGVKDDSVPGYLVLRPAFRSRFQLQTPRLKDVIRYAKRVSQIDERAPGDHKRVTINGEHIQINRAKHGDTIDLASAKALAKAMGLSLYELCQTI
jgi:hypothetical protein